MENYIPEEALERKVWKHITDIMESSKQHKEGQTQKEVTALESLDKYFIEAISAWTDIKKREIAKKVFDVY